MRGRTTRPWRYSSTGPAASPPGFRCSTTHRLLQAVGRAGGQRRDSCCRRRTWVRLPGRQTRQWRLSPPLEGTTETASRATRWYYSCFKSNRSHMGTRSPGFLRGGARNRPGVPHSGPLSNVVGGNGFRRAVAVLWLRDGEAGIERNGNGRGVSLPIGWRT